jgi:hypothetical protein
MSAPRKAESDGIQRKKKGYGKIPQHRFLLRIYSCGMTGHLNICSGKSVSRKRKMLCKDLPKSLPQEMGAGEFYSPLNDHLKRYLL